MISLKHIINENVLETDIEHTVGNSLFALETNLEPLRKRIRENRIAEALEIVDALQISIEKAKRGLAMWKARSQ